VNESPELLMPEPEPPEPGIPFWTKLDLFVMAILWVAAMFLGSLLVQIVVAVVPAKDEIPAIGVLAAQFIGYGIWLACLYALLHFMYDRPFWSSMAWNKPPGHIVLYAAIGPVLAIAIGLVGNLMQTPELDLPMMELMKGRLSLTTMGIFAVTLGPLCEEIVFRGFYLPRLAKSLGVVTGVLITSVVFALMHGPQYAWSWRHILLITAAGAAFCVVRLKTNSTAAATVMHATYNLTFFIAYIVQLEAIGVTW
jgi:CAAX protease family protein